MRDAGYDDDFSCAITGASSIIGPIIPPSVPLGDLWDTCQCVHRPPINGRRHNSWRFGEAFVS